MKKKFLAFCFLGLFSIKLFAQFVSINDYVVRIWSSIDGLPSNSVLDVIQSSDGYMYFGTYEGLVKFDGFDFVTLNKYSEGGDREKFNFVSARAIFQDSNDNIWVGTNDEGLLCVGKDKQVKFTTQNGLPNNSIRSINEDRKHNIWVGTASGVVYITPNGEICKPYAGINIDFNNVIITQIFIDSAGRVWLITSESNGLFLYTDNAFSRYKAFDKFGEYNVTSVTQDKSGNFWFGMGKDGICKAGNGVVTPIKTNTILDSVTTWSIYADDSGAIWFGTERGLVLYRDGEFSEYIDDNTMMNASINRILGDREGNIWIVSDKAGIGKISPGKFRMHALKTAVNAICEDSDGLVWVGTDDGLMCFDNEVAVSNELTEFTKGTRVRHIALANNGDILVNCYSEPAQVRYSKQEIKNWTEQDGLAGNRTRVSLEAKNGDLYCGTTTGLSVITSDGNINNYTIANGLECEYVMCLYEEADGHIWIGTDGGGIFIMKDGKIVGHITSDNGLAGNVIFKIKQDENGAFWICTGSSISKLNCSDVRNFNSESKLDIRNINSENGIGSDSVFQLLPDKNSYTWMISNRGISNVLTTEIDELIKGERQKLNVKFFTQNDGLKSAGPNSTALSMLDKHGRIWFTLTDGFAIYDPLRARSGKVLPLVHIVSVEVDNTVYTDFSDTIIIPPDTKHIQVQYTGLSFTASERNRFIYKMDGFDNDYSELTDRRSVNYTNLKPGDYTFYVTVQNSEGDFSEGPACVSFIQKAHFYQLPVFWISVAVFIILVLVLIIIVNNRMNKKRQLLLETKIQMATVELQMAKDDSDRLLKNILPVSIAERLKGIGGNKTIADSFENVTVLFSDIVGFTNTTSNATAEDIVSSLNDLISRFDKRAASMGVEKIKTIGDAYMAACGVPVPNEKHAVIMLKFAIGMYKDLSEYNKTAKIKFRLRIGLNSGKVIAGVIGQNKFIYDIWGDTVNVASRMESNCTPGHIRMTESVKKNLDANHVSFKCREVMCDVKGKGMMKTFELPE